MERELSSCLGLSAAFSRTGSKFAPVPTRAALPSRRDLGPRPPRVSDDKSHKSAKLLLLTVKGAGLAATLSQDLRTERSRLPGLRRHVS